MINHNCLHFPVSLSVMTIRVKFVTYILEYRFSMTYRRGASEDCITMQNQNNLENQIFNSTVSVNYINMRIKKYFLIIWNTCTKYELGVIKTTNHPFGISSIWLQSAKIITSLYSWNDFILLICFGNALKYF